jgi:hypothetical protein
MNKIVTILLFLTIISCDSDKKQWRETKRISSFSNIFKFAYCNRESAYLDSALIMLDDSLSHSKDFWLWIHDDTIESIKIDHSVMYKIPKENIVLYNVNSNTLKYIDSVYTSKSAIDSIILNFVHKIQWGGFYIYSDTLVNKDDWSALFSTIDKTVNAYKTERERYSKNKYGIAYKNINDSIKKAVIRSIRMPIALYFKNPFPTPPPLTEEELKKVFEDMKYTKD